jgi:glycosidase
VVELVEEAHRRGMRVIADLVVNHTSDQHPWFQESRQDRTNPKADWYVWDDDDTRWSEARVIFVDTERSNWTFDPVRGQYFWHRFFHHQPDLNYRNPEVQPRHARRGPVLAGHRPRRLPPRRRALPVRGATAPTARTCPRRTSS